MESGGKAVTKRYRKKITVALSLVLPVIVLFAILNCFTTYVFYEDYKYKMNLMTEIAAKEEFSGLDAVSELLKDKDIETNEQGRRLLEQYGYWGNKGNAFYSQFRHQVMVTGAVSTVICVLLLTSLTFRFLSAAYLCRTIGTVFCPIAARRKRAAAYRATLQIGFPAAGDLFA